MLLEPRLNVGVDRQIEEFYVLDGSEIAWKACVDGLFKVSRATEQRTPSQTVFLNTRAGRCS